MSKFNNSKACACDSDSDSKPTCACPPDVLSDKYGEADTLRAIEKFRNFYEDKLKQIDIDGGGDCTELKLKLQERWIKDLTEQTEMMARIVKELEEEATSRVRMLENKLKQTSKAAYEVMKRYQTYNITHTLDEHFQKAFYLENDLKNVLEFIRRIREDGKWSINGLQFYDVTYENLFGTGKNVQISEFNDDDLKDTPLISLSNGIDSSEQETVPTTKNEQTLDNEELLKKKDEEYEALRQSMLDMRSALTEEVACKHDMILALKKDVLQLEERCLQADKQTAFKDDIIKELRKEIKQLKQQLKKENEEKKSEEVEDLEKKLKEAEAKIRRMRPCVDTKTACTAVDDLLAAREKKLEDEIRSREKEVGVLKDKCQELEKALSSSQARGGNLQKADSKRCNMDELKKLRQQKRCYEHVLACFKHEMTVMSEQLKNLQEILRLSNQSCKEENCQLYGTIADLQNATGRLKNKLKDAEQKILLENQMNQLKDAKIDELQSVIGQKNADLNVHDEAIRAMSQKLENAALENQQLQATITSLNNKILELQCALCPECLQHKDKKSTTVSEAQGEKTKEIDSLQSELEKKDKKLNRLHKDYVAQCEILKTLEEEFDKVKEKNKEKVKSLKRQNENIKEKLTASEDNHQKMVNELSKVQEQLAQLAQRDINREQELLQSKQIIIDMRQALIELNENLAESELQQMTLVEEHRKRMIDERQQEDIYLSCQCEIALYRKLVQSLKDMLLKLKRNKADREHQIRSMHDELKHKDMKLAELQKKMVKKEKETSQNIKDLKEKLRQSHEEERRLNDFIENLKSQVQQRLQQSVNQGKECRCDEHNNKQQMAATQEEISGLKVEIKRMIENQLALNNENDKLLRQVTCLQTSHNSLDEANHHLKQKIEKLQLENQKLKENIKNIVYERDMFAHTIKNLEMELAEARCNRDDVCAESKQVVNNVKAWLEEQRRINDRVKKRTQCYCDTITKLQQQNENLQNKMNTPPAPTVKTKNKPGVRFCSYSPPPPQTNDDFSEPYCCDSLGNDSPRDSPSSFLTCSVEDWYSPNYRDETDLDSDSEFVNRLEAVAVEMINNNQKWKDKYKECECMKVSKDDK